MSSGARSVLSVSVEGAWSCTSAAEDVAVWFRGAASRLDLVEGEDFVLWPGEAGAPPCGWVDVLHVADLCGGARTATYPVVVTTAARAVRSAVRRPIADGVVGLRRRRHRR